MSCDRKQNIGYADWYIEEFVDEFKKYRDYLLRSEDKAKEFFIRVGILDKNGNLSEHYKKK